MVTIAHISDLHCGGKDFYPKKLSAAIKEINRLRPDAVVVTGDLTHSGFRDNYILAKRYLDRIKADKLIVPGNHDARLCGYKYFDEFFGHGNNKVSLDGVKILGIDTTVPDLDEGDVGRGKLRWLEAELNKIPGGHKIIAMHHHLVSIPDTGRERSTVADAGDVLKTLVQGGVDLVLCGHKHTPYSWLVNDVAIVNAGSVSCRKLRAHINNSYNIIKIKDGSIEVLRKEVGKRPVSMAVYEHAPE